MTFSSYQYVAIPMHHSLNALNKNSGSVTFSVKYFIRSKMSFISSSSSLGKVHNGKLVVTW
jgi:hypothetical protein